MWKPCPVRETTHLMPDWSEAQRNGARNRSSARRRARGSRIPRCSRSQSRRSGSRGRSSAARGIHRDSLRGLTLQQVTRRRPCRSLRRWRQRMFPLGERNTSAFRLDCPLLHLLPGASDESAAVPMPETCVRRRRGSSGVTGASDGGLLANVVPNRGQGGTRRRGTVWSSCHAPS